MGRKTIAISGKSIVKRTETPFLVPFWVPPFLTFANYFVKNEISLGKILKRNLRSYACAFALVDGAYPRYVWGVVCMCGGGLV